MSRRGQNMTWRVHHPTLDDPPDMSTDYHLQSVGVWGDHLRWITVARGNPEYLKKIAEALNRARFLLFPLRPGDDAKEMQHVRNHSDGTVGDGSSSVRGRRRKLPVGKVEGRGRAKKSVRRKKGD